MSPGALVREVLQTVLRMLPWPTEAGLRRIGSPGPDSPVLVTCDYDLTVRRLMRSLEGAVDAWLVVAPAKGINVWCAAAGGHLTTHQVVTALKTSGVADQVVHRTAILPQLAATGVIGLDVFRRAHWRVRFGPVRAEDIPRYLAQGAEKDDAMRRVRFGARERLEMSVAWGVPAALVLVLIAALLAPDWALPLGGLALGLACAVFGLYDRLPEPRRLLLLVAATALSFGAVGLAGGGIAAFGAALVANVGLVGLLTFDYAGSTPLEGGSHFEGRRWRIDLDLERCKGVYSCWEVCPEACFEKREELHQVVLAHDERCIRCGACVVQCPKDALSFRDDEGARIEPDVIRRFKLNLLGHRTVATDDEARRDAEPG